MRQLFILVLAASLLSACSVGREVRDTARAGADIYGSVNDLRDEARRWETWNDRGDVQRKRLEYEADLYEGLLDREYGLSSDYGGGYGGGSSAGQWDPGNPFGGYQGNADTFNLR